MSVLHHTPTEDSLITDEAKENFEKINDKALAVQESNDA